MKLKFMEGKVGKWLKRIIVVLLIVGLLAFGAYKLIANKTNNVEKNALETLEKLNSYYMEANMEFFKGEDSRKYGVKVSYKKDNGDDLFRVSMYDKASEQEQIIVKNNDGVFVLTPALNQVYKFKGDWPLNGHKPYLYQSMIETIQGTCDISSLDEGYLIVSTLKINNMPSWSRQEMKFTKEYKPEWVHIYDNNNDVAVKISFSKVEFNPTFAESYFDVNSNMSEARNNLTSQTSSTIYDLPYYPVNADVDASLKEVSNITINSDKQVMLTYSGNQGFTVLESTAKSAETMEIIEINGEIEEIYGIIGYSTSNNNINKLFFTYQGVSYQIWSDSVSVATLIEIASGMEHVDDNVEK
ncbi:MAG: hypothetical protein MR270_03855 [Erysipelotrichaceae bacterium]|nr:hypothetical protein [Erysipelotrichaceae bacterium]